MSAYDEHVPLVPHVSAFSYVDSKWQSLRYRKKCFWTLLILTPILLMPFVTVTPAAFELQYKMVCRYMGLDESDEQCSSNSDVNSYIARYNYISRLLFTIPQVFMVPVVMALVEKIGLVWGFIFCLSGLGLQVFGLVPLTYWVPAHWSPYRGLIFDFAAMMTGVVCQGNILVLATTQLFPEPELRPKYFGRMLSATAIAGLIGPSIGTWGCYAIGLNNWFLVASIWLVISTALFVYYVRLPPLITVNSDDASTIASETVSEAEEPVVMAQKRSLLSNLAEQLHALKVFEFSHLPTLGIRITAMFLTLWIGLFRELDTGDMDLIILYSKQYLGWHQDGVSKVITLFSASTIFWNTLGFPIVQKFMLKYYKTSADSVDSIDKFFILLGVGFQTVGLFLMSVFKGSNMFTFGLLVFSCIQASTCIVKPALLKLVPTEEATTLMTALTVLDTICGAVIPSLIMWVYERTLSWWPTMLFETQCILSLTYLVSAYFLIRIS